MSDLKTLLYSHPHGWAPIGSIMERLKDEGFVFTKLERDNRTDGEWHYSVSSGDKTLELNANIWINSSFDDLVDWYEGFKTIGA